jgi:hypothetical protein
MGEIDIFMVYSSGFFPYALYSQFPLAVESLTACMGLKFYTALKLQLSLQMRLDTKNS